ncbi:MAG: hypothetical protein H0Z18_08040 [Thermococcus sp.]|uniref:hypothetical protein n=1 Tax=Thermococcus sp. TaxID=35749 RepID=UPI001E0B4472|nr:hypothetical protein [Thermococcus sp.]MBO8175193.1 hypothetical protein [Thermococcus sp.]
MRGVLSILLLIGLVIASAGCIRQEGGAIILNFGNETYTFTLPENQTNTTTTTAPGQEEPQEYVYEKTVEVGQKLTILELNFEIAPDYDATEGKFFFVTTNGVYWEPMNITVDNVSILGEGYWVGTTTYVAKITIASLTPLTIEVTTK